MRPWDENGRSSKTALPEPASVNIKKLKYHFYMKEEKRVEIVLVRVLYVTCSMEERKMGFQNMNEYQLPINIR